MKLIIALHKGRRLKRVAQVLMIVFLIQIGTPVVTYALTTGPTQPEVMSFEPVGTTDMVDMFTGDFVYNIPLLDVEGYPVNIAYHSGLDMETEASWVGLGWNINPGVINRAMRGLPDDLNGQEIQKTTSIKPEENIRVGVGLGAEFFGAGEPMWSMEVGLGASINMSNYRGVSADLSLSAGVNLMPFGSPAVNMGTGFAIGIGSQTGADVDYHLGLGFGSSGILSSQLAANLGFSYNSGYNTRSGLKDKSWGASIGAGAGGRSMFKLSGRATVPVALRNYVPVITNSTRMQTYKGQIKLGAELYGIYGYGLVNGMYSKLTHHSNGTRKGYGYLYLQNSDESSILDFTRDKDGLFHQEMNYLPAGTMTYDVYAVSGQGTGGSFRPFRNDFGSVFDPATSSGGSDISVEVEVGVYPNLFELGGNVHLATTETEAGPWAPYKKKFSTNTNGDIYENTYFKLAGEITESGNSLGQSPVDGKSAASFPLVKAGSGERRTARGTLMYYFTGSEASRAGVATSTDIRSYNSTNGFGSGPEPSVTSISRTSGNRNSSQISEIVQVEKDARRYVYSIPAMNNSQKEVTFSVSPTSSANGLISYDPSDATTSNSKGIDNYYSSTTTPSYAHSYLLTSVLSDDYVDVKGDGPTDDDFGTYTKFNYTRKNAGFKWKSPYGENTAQYNPGFKSDKQDDKASFVEGNREQWYLHSIETKNYIAEFYVSERLDALGVDQETDLSFKLDSIKLYNKNDRFVNAGNAIPIKTVIFSYDYELCQGTPNSIAPGNGKLTLKKIYFRYGNSDLGMLSPYTFEYGSNYNYSVANKDRWGLYKPQDPLLPNADFPFVNQRDGNNDLYAGAWSLSRVNLPSGGKINVQYESDDYAYVQDKTAMEMMVLKGVGTTPLYVGSNQLFYDINSPNCYFYFQRDTDREVPGLTPEENYFADPGALLYYNFDVKLVDAKYENIKGYAEVDTVGYCSDGVHAFIKTKAVDIKSGSGKLPHPSYTAINFARYHLPHIIYPGSDPDVSDMTNILAGLKSAFGELLGIMKNPVVRLANQGKGKEVKLSTSFVRMQSPGLRKKGGGQRVKQLTFEDNWNKLAGGNNHNATYGKKYDYTTQHQDYGVISSGVASYEPMIGGDENPFRTPDPFLVQRGSTFPPNDPVSLYQEMPVGESFFPPPVVGYSKVTISSIHEQTAHSAQAQDIYEYYTAKDFPVEVMATTLDGTKPKEAKFSFKEQKFVYEGSQGFSFVFNDMHGKMKKTERRVKKTSGVYEVVNWNQYNYFTSGNQVSNHVPVIEYDADSLLMRKTYKTMGVESDITFDTRQKKEHTKSNTFYVNLNTFIVIPPYPVPIPFWYDFQYNMKNEFYSVVATKTIQKYGILKEVVSFNEGAVTTVRNEAFDPVTGQALITSVNNEFRDLEYTVSYPAYWGYKSMGPSYENTGFQAKYDVVNIGSHKGILPVEAAQYLKVGDELYITYREGSTTKENNVWVTGYDLSGTTESGVSVRFCYNDYCEPPTVVDTQNVTTGYPWLLNFNKCTGNNTSILISKKCQARPVIEPRYKASFPESGTITDVQIKVVRSGAKNQLSNSILQYTGMEEPVDGNGILSNSLSKLINISAYEYSDTNYAVLPQFDSFYNPGGWDDLNIYVNGTRGIKKVFREYTYQTERNYAAGTRTRQAGLFNATPLWILSQNDSCKDTTIYCVGQVTYRFDGKVGHPDVSENLYFQVDPLADQKWIVSRTVNKWAPWGYELQNMDAIGNYSSATYGHKNLIPTVVAQNARQFDIFHESFEDYRVLGLTNSLTKFHNSPFYKLFNELVFGTTSYSWKNLTGIYSHTLVSTLSHSGNYCLGTTASGSGTTVKIPVLANADEANKRTLQPFKLTKGKTYIVSLWFRPKSTTPTMLGYTPPGGYVIKSNIIEGWQQIQMEISIPAVYGSEYTLQLPANAYVDDIRVFPKDANIKAFIYHPVNQKLVASLDENNFASFFEYDPQGNLIRTKKETERGVMTINESRSAHPKTSN